MRRNRVSPVRGRAWLLLVPYWTRNVLYSKYTRNHAVNELVNPNRIQTYRAIKYVSYCKLKTFQLTKMIGMAIYILMLNIQTKRTSESVHISNKCFIFCLIWALLAEKNIILLYKSHVIQSNIFNMSHWMVSLFYCIYLWKNALYFLVHAFRQKLRLLSVTHSFHYVKCTIYLHSVSAIIQQVPGGWQSRPFQTGAV